jgi:aldose 1-epimerase
MGSKAEHPIFKENDSYSFSTSEHIDRVTKKKFITLRAESEVDPNRNIQIAVAPELGSNLVQLRRGQHDIIDTDWNKLKDGLWTGCFNLWPLPNRVMDRKYRFRDQEVSLEKIRRKGIKEEDPLIHGLVDEQVWKADKPVIGNDSVSLKTRVVITKDGPFYKGAPLYKFFPWESELTMEYVVTKDGLEIRYEARNNEPKRDMPSEFAIHPYFDARGAEVKIPARSVMDTDKLLIPSGILLAVKGTQFDLREYAPVAGLDFDHVWTDLVPGQYPAIRYPERGYDIVMQTSPDVTHTVLYTGQVNEGHFCLEPQTGSTDAINLDNEARDRDGNILEPELVRAAHLVVTPPNDSHSGWIKFEINSLAQAT